MKIKLGLIIFSMALAAPVQGSDADDASTPLQNALATALQDAELRHKLFVSALKERADKENKEDVLLYCADMAWARHVSNDRPVPKPSLILDSCNRLLEQYVYTDN